METVPRIMGAFTDSPAARTANAAANSGEIPTMAEARETPANSVPV